MVTYTEVYFYILAKAIGGI
ncbi:uncharacterized protein FFE2_03904 [Fusarium fujikuroi]|nr:uncharacterized protein FFE2_03904 [Fusarium fujikuroi]SCN96091.1 uncharacterized protein FFC1_07487 [Fusarium fujikuroi]SCV30545.1 uncharacterized protein FFFS_02337 [Fusarium fujikuroi]